MLLHLQNTYGRTVIAEALIEIGKTTTGRFPAIYDPWPHRWRWGHQVCPLENNSMHLWVS